MDDGTGPPQDGRPRPRSARPIARFVPRPLQEFLSTSTSSGTILLVAVALALAWANSPWASSYESFWRSPRALGFGDLSLTKDLRHWVNEGLMALFFLVVGLEIKREVLTGELRRARVAALPAIAALTGMAAPALVYVAVVRGGDGSNGWAIPVATDIVLSLGVLALAGDAAPRGLRPLLLALAIVDDIVAVLLVAIVFPSELQLGWLAAAVAVAAAFLQLPRIHVHTLAVSAYVALAVAMWVSFEGAGGHPTLAGVVVGLLTPAQPFPRSRSASDATAADVPPGTAPALAPVEHALLPWTSFVVVPLFALANIGVEVSAATPATAAASVVFWAIVAARTVGKFLGVWGGSVVAVGAGIVELPEGVRRRHVAAMAVATGAGFTVPLFVAELALTGDALTQAKLGLLVATLIAGAVGVATLRATREDARVRDVRAPTR